MNTDFDEDDFVKLRSYKYTAYGEFYRYYPKSIADAINADNKRFSAAYTKWLKSDQTTTLEQFTSMWLSGLVASIK